MERKKLIELLPDAPKEAIDEIMAINGSDINKAKADAKAVSEELESAKQQLAEAQETINELKANADNADELKKQIQAFEAKESERAKAEEEAKANKVIADRFSKVVGERKFLNDYTSNGVMAEFKTALTDDANVGKSDKEIYDAIIKDRDGLFALPNQKADIVPPKSETPAVSDNEARAIMGLPTINK